MRYSEDDLKLSSGKVLSCNRGIVGLGAAPEFEMGEGYDGTFYKYDEQKRYQEWLTPDDSRSLTRPEIIELCDIMIARWQAYKTKLEAEQ